nr:unnamed protein product [Callosobruchus analis]
MTVQAARENSKICSSIHQA